MSSATPHPHQSIGGSRTKYDGTGGKQRSAGVSQASLRGLNLAVIVQHIFSSPEPLSRAAIAEKSGLNRSTISRLVDDLLRAGIVRELDPLVPRRGRPSTPLAPARGTLAAVGLEIAPRHLAGRVLDLSGSVLAEETLDVDFGSASLEAVLNDLAALTRRLSSAAGVRLIGSRLAVPGLVDAAGRVFRATHLGWWDVAVADHLRDILDMPFVIRNEADLAAFANALSAPGRPRAAQRFFYVSVDVGIGGACVVDGLPATGPRGWAGEIGHTLIDPDGPRCTCGAIGCLEQYVGRDALLTAAGLPRGTTPEEIVIAARRSSRVHDAVERAGWALGIALGNVVNLLDIDDIILGGQLIELFEILRPPLKAELDSRVLSTPWLDVNLRTGDRGLPALTGGCYDVLSDVVANPASWMPNV